VADPFSASALEEILDNEETREILESFLEDTGGLVEIIESAVVNQDSEVLRRNSHKLQGCCRAISAKESQLIGAKLEDCAVACDWSQAEALIPRLKSSYAAISEGISRYLNGA
jgi:HPt (histidine-containing phosphotransfer) domain-containing protein